jgi:hypothetical protein
VRGKKSFERLPLPQRCRQRSKRPVGAGFRDQRGPILERLGIPCLIEAVPIAGTRGPSFLDHQVIRQFLNTRGLPTRDRLDQNDYSEPAITGVKYRARCSILHTRIYQAHALQNLAPAAPLNERRPARDFLTASKNARLGQRRQKKQKPEQPSTKHANAPNKRPKELDHCEYSDETDREDTDISIKAKQLGNPSACPRESI